MKRHDKRRRIGRQSKGNGRRPAVAAGDDLAEREAGVLGRAPRQRIEAFAYIALIFMRIRRYGGYVSHVGAVRLGWVTSAKAPDKA